MKKSVFIRFTLPFLLSCSSACVEAATTNKAVVENYATIAHAVFADSLQTAKGLQQKIDALLKSPSAANLDAARAAWVAARVPYMQSEVFRFGNPNVDEWEGQLNAWPLDEGLIDYVAASYEPQMGNDAGLANVIGNTSLEFAGESMDVSQLTPELLASLNELMGADSNVATGYHAIEFLLWGQDLNGHKPGAGQRPYTDFVNGKGCTHGHCDRRGQYLKAAVQLLVADLQAMEADWAPGKADNYHAQLLKEPELKAINKMLFGMGSLSLGELAGERMKVALEANSPEDEQDCFSDNTHHSHYYDAKGIQNIYYGTYKRVDGSVVKGASLAELVKTKDAALAAKADAAFAGTERAMQAMVAAAENKARPMKFDQMIAAGNNEGRAMVKNAIQSLVAQTRTIEDVAKALGIKNLHPDSADHQF